ncbi:MAG: hypothetical protein H0V07_15115 [Propionibacteriales bacterium]|nr:hypothetical protein [Propionibacteriales bacterium]
MSINHAQGVAVTQARMVTIPQGPFTILGNQIGGHPIDAHSAQLLAASRPAVGAEIAGGQTINLILYLHSPRGGSMGPVQVGYNDTAGQAHLWTGGSWLTIKHGKSC